MRLYIALKHLVSLLGRLVACSARIVGLTYTHTHTHTQTNYCNPCCACAPRVNYLDQSVTQLRTHIFKDDVSDAFDDSSFALSCPQLLQKSA